MSQSQQELLEYSPDQISVFHSSDKLNEPGVELIVDEVNSFVDDNVRAVVLLFDLLNFALEFGRGRSVSSTALI